VNLGRFERFFQNQRRQNRSEPFGQHRFSRAGRANQEHVVATSRGDFQSPLDRFLSFHFGKIKFVIVRLLENFVDINFGWGDFYLPFEKIGRLTKIADWNDLQPGDDCRFGGVVGRNEHARFSLGSGAQGDGQNSFHRPDSPCWEFASARFTTPGREYHRISDG
jgi:hypothetical protein